MRKISRPVSLAIALGAAWASPAAAQAGQPPHDHERHRDAAMIQTPASLSDEHQHLRGVLDRAAGEPGRLGEAARTLRALLDPHFRREEEIATPPLGLLLPLSRGEPMPAMQAVLPMTAALERELPAMLEEHRAIRVAVAAFRTAAQAAGREEYVRFSDSLAAHARQEEEILYPAAVLVGRHVAQALSAGEGSGPAGEHDHSESQGSMAAENVVARHPAGCSCPCCRMRSRQRGGGSGADQSAVARPALRVPAGRSTPPDSQH